MYIIHGSHQDPPSHNGYTLSASSERTPGTRYTYRRRSGLNIIQDLDIVAVVSGSVDRSGYPLKYHKYMSLNYCALERAFGSQPDCLGIIVVRDLPRAYPASRERLLNLAYRFASLDENVRERFADAKSRYR